MSIEEPFIDPVALRALRSKPIGRKLVGLVEWMLCPDCGRRDWVGIEGTSSCPDCGSGEALGTGPLDYTRVKGLGEHEFEVDLSAEEWEQLLDGPDGWHRPVLLLEAVENSGWATATALLDEWGIEHSLRLRVPV